MYEEQFRQNHGMPEPDRPLKAFIHNPVTSDGEDLFVTLENVDARQRVWGPVLGWQVITDSSGTPHFPYAGAPATVVINDDNEIWMIGWWPYA